MFLYCFLKYAKMFWWFLLHLISSIKNFAISAVKVFAIFTVWVFDYIFSKKRRVHDHLIVIMISSIDHQSIDINWSSINWHQFHTFIDINRSSVDWHQLIINQLISKNHQSQTNENVFFFERLIMTSIEFFDFRLQTAMHASTIIITRWDRSNIVNVKYDWNFFREN